MLGPTQRSHPIERAASTVRRTRTEIDVTTVEALDEALAEVLRDTTLAAEGVRFGPAEETPIAH